MTEQELVAAVADAKEESRRIRFSGDNNGHGPSRRLAAHVLALAKECRILVAERDDVRHSLNAQLTAAQEEVARLREEIEEVEREYVGEIRALRAEVERLQQLCGDASRSLKMYDSARGSPLQLELHAEELKYQARRAALAKGTKT